MIFFRFIRNTFFMVAGVNILMYLAIIADVNLHSADYLKQHNWEQTFNSISNGQSKGAVVKVLGQPAKAENDQWSYNCPGYDLSNRHWCIGTISFDKFGKVANHTLSASNSLEMFR